MALAGVRVDSCAAALDHACACCPSGHGHIHEDLRLLEFAESLDDQQLGQDFERQALDQRILELASPRRWGVNYLYGRVLADRLHLGADEAQGQGYSRLPHLAAVDDS